MQSYRNLITASIVLSFFGYSSAVEVQRNNEQLVDAVYLYAVQDFAEALPRLRFLADENEPVAQTLLGRMYLEGEGVQPDIAKATVWLRRAAKNDAPDAMMMLAKLISAQHEGQSDSEALHWFVRAAEFQLPEAFTEIANIYLMRGGRSNLSAAHRWLHKGTAKLDGASFFLLGKLYSQGTGVQKDIVSAYVWFDLAARTSIEPEYRLAKETLRERLSPSQVEFSKKAANAWIGFYDRANVTRSLTNIENTCPGQLVSSEVYMPSDQFCPAGGDLTDLGSPTVR